jgi:hypothetical protein
MHKSRLLGIMCACLFSIGAMTSVHASLLIGAGTLNSADDLTIVQTSSGEVLEWLDLSVTKGMTVSDAVSTYQEDEFRWATGNDVTELYGAFGFTYSITYMGAHDLGIDAATAQNFVDYLGTTLSSSALGWVDDLNIGTYHTHDCIGIDCNPTGFLINVPTFWPSNHSLGVYLVRNVSAVPIPAAVWLFGSGLLGLIGIARRKKAT